VQELVAEAVAVLEPVGAVELVVAEELAPLAEEAEVPAEPAAVEVKGSLSRELDLRPLRRVRVCLLRQSSFLT